MNKAFNRIMGAIIGVINIVVGACGGIIAVECLKKNKLNQTKAHATAISIILPMTMISAGLYIYRNHNIISDSFVFLIPGILGAMAGATLLPHIPTKVLKKAFSVFMIYAGIRMIIK